MTIELFMFLFTFGSAASSLLTQAMKKAFPYVSSNLLAVFDALVVGLFGTLAAYVLMGVYLDAKNTICMVLMAICIAVGSMVGYDKVLQTLEQLKRG